MIGPDLINATCDVLVKTRTTSRAGGKSFTWGEPSPPRNKMPCRMEKMQAGLSDQLKGRRTKARVMFFFDYEPSITDEMALRHGGIVYAIEDVEDVANMGELWQVTALYVSGAS